MHRHSPGSLECPDEMRHLGTHLATHEYDEDVSPDFGIHALFPSKLRQDVRLCWCRILRSFSIHSFLVLNKWISAPCCAN